MEWWWGRRAPAWHQAPRPPAPSKGSASSTAGYTSPTGYTLPENLSTRQGNRHAPSKSVSIDQRPPHALTKPIRRARPAMRAS